MADRDTVSTFDEMERAGLEKAISDAGTMLASSGPGTRPLLENFVQNAKARLGALEKKIKDAERKEEIEAQQRVAGAAELAERETALNAQEKGIFRGFLEKEFFTESDLGQLEQFYTNTWDRLSERGKDEMSHRIWEGIRRDEYKFTDLPKIVQEKEAARVYQVLGTRGVDSRGAAGIPEKDKLDFIRAYESGNHDETSRILDRPSFRENLFRGTELANTEHKDVSKGREMDASALAGNASKKTEERKREPDLDALSLAELKLDSIDLGGMQPGTQGTEAGAGGIPRASNEPIRKR